MRNYERLQDQRVKQQLHRVSFGPEQKVNYRSLDLRCPSQQERVFDEFFSSAENKASLKAYLQRNQGKQLGHRAVDHKSKGSSRS